MEGLIAVTGVFSIIMFLTLFSFFFAYQYVEKYENYAVLAGFTSVVLGIYSLFSIIYVSIS